MFTFAAYNAGFGTIFSAQETCEKHGLNENPWRNIEEVAPKVQKWRYGETIGYVNKIERIMG